MERFIGWLIEFTFIILALQGVERIERLIRGGLIDNALREAVEALKGPWVSKDEYVKFLDILVAKREIKKLGRYIKRYKELFEEDGDYKNFFAIYLFRTLKVRKLLEILPETYDEVKFWILSAMGYTLEAEKYIHNGPYRKMQIAFLRGERFNFEDVIPEYNLQNVLKSKYEALLNLAYGNINKASELLDLSIEQSLNGGFTGWALDTLVYKCAITLDLKDILLAKNFSKLLGDKFNLKKAEIIESAITGNIPKVPKYPILQVMKEYAQYVYNGVGRMEVYEGLEGLYNMWWYVDKIKNDKTYLSFVGRLRLMKGKEEIKINKRYLLVLAYWKIFGKDYLLKKAKIIFPHSKEPHKRVIENLSRLGRYRYVSTDFKIAKRTGFLLQDEENNLWKRDFTSL